MGRARFLNPHSELGQTDNPGPALAAASAPEWHIVLACPLLSRSSHSSQPTDSRMVTTTIAEQDPDPAQGRQIVSQTIEELLQSLLELGICQSQHVHDRWTHAIAGTD